MSTLSTAIEATGGLIQTDTALSLGAIPAPITIDSEAMLVTAAQSGTGYAVSRGENGTARATHALGATITLGWSGAAVATPDAGDVAVSPAVNSETNVQDALATLAAGSVVEVTKNLSAANIATLQSVPITVLAGQGAGTLIWPIAAILEFTPGASPYAVDTGTVGLKVGTSLAFSMTAPFLNEGSIERTAFSVQTWTSNASSENAALTVAGADADPGGAGNGTARVFVRYVVLTV